MRPNDAGSTEKAVTETGDGDLGISVPGGSVFNAVKIAALPAIFLSLSCSGSWCIAAIYELRNSLYFMTRHVLSPVSGRLAAVEAESHP